jgi:2-oxoglutarate ferredoxin oxidoreductase subunit delta
MRGTIIVNESLCKGCDYCASVCPKKLIHAADYFNARGYHPMVLEDLEGLCTGCLLCSTVCPEGGITVYREAARKAESESRVGN